MATEGQGLLTQFGDDTKWIDVDPLVELLTPTADWFYRNLQEGKKAESDVVEVEEDTLDTVATAAVAIEADFVYPALSTPTRRKNIVSLLVKPLKVGWMQQWVRHFHGQSELPRQASKKLKSWVDSVEFDFVRATLVSGVSGTAPKMSLGCVLFRSTENNTKNPNNNFSISIRLLI